MKCLACKKEFNPESQPCYAIKYQTKNVNGVSCLGLVCHTCGIEIVTVYKYYIDITEQI